MMTTAIGGCYARIGLEIEPLECAVPPQGFRQSLAAGIRNGVVG